ncbi:endolytic transglycosylase MltG [Microbacterium indicum]|uniref:endolytic transglycosylase MltG n=1 Tax=Microbacterium indicum TaxID=358100 RepID=UPI0003FEECA9|nr:endolytic transglycosylase MltG [Microbacterium indicum]
MTSSETPDGRPMTRRELRERLERARARQAALEREQLDQAPAAPAEPEPVAAEPAELPAAAPDEPAAKDPTPGAEEAATSTRTASHDLHDLFAEAERKPHRRRRRGGCLLAIVIVLAIVAAIGGAGYWAVTSGPLAGVRGQIEQVLGINQAPTDYEDGEATGEAVIVIHDGDTGFEVSQTLNTEGVTLTPNAFYAMLLRAQVSPNFQPGTYLLQKKMTSNAALEALEDPANKLEDAVAYPEGYTVDQIVPILASGLDVSEDDVRSALSDPSAYGVDADSLEGWLFPASYPFEPGTSVADAIQAMVDRTVQSLDDAGVPEADRQRVLTIASIIQREARYQDDFYRVSRVIENRLDGVGESDGRLQMDSTAQYGYGEMHEGSASSSAEALADDNPWNTYVHTGLPATPISNPGDVAIDAAMHPADGSWLYFVTVDLTTGETVFSDTYAEHEEAVAQWTAWCEANPDQGC